METLSLMEIAGALRARCNTDAQVTHICLDHREVTEGSLFFAIKGERFDGHDFIGQALHAGAVAAVAHKQTDNDTEKPVLLVHDTRKALLELAGWYRRRFEVFLAAVTGSVGKTSTKDMIYTVLSSKYITLRTEGNFNNEIGLPKTLFRLGKSDEAVVIEMGMSGFGEIRKLSKAAYGDVGVITNIGVSHIEKLGSRENILKAKLEILEGLKPKAPLIVNADDDLLGKLEYSDRPVFRYGIKNADVDVKAEGVSQSGMDTVFTICYDGREYPAHIPVIGEHHVLNALAAFAVGIRAGMTPEEIVAALPHYESSGMRQKMVDFHGITVIEDCYNASPDSMKASLAVLSMLKSTGSRVAVLGDMLELGGYSETAHRLVGQYAADSRLDALLCFGDEARFIADEAEKQGVGKCICFEEKEAVAHWLKSNLKEGDTVLFKASRGMKFEEIISAFYGKQ